MEIQLIQEKIFEIRGKRVMLDFDLSALYEVETRVLNQAVKRNIDLFPDDFMFQLNEKDWNNMSSQIVMTYPAKRPRSSFPFAFTEHGVIMLANVLRSKKARLTSIFVVRAFVALKTQLEEYNELSQKLKDLEKKYDRQFDDIYAAINFLIEKRNADEKQNNRKKIGY